LTTVKYQLHAEREANSRLEATLAAKEKALTAERKIREGVDQALAAETAMRQEADRALATERASRVEIDQALADERESREEVDQALATEKRGRKRAQEELYEAFNCMVCFDQPRTKSLLPYKHVVMCKTCSYKVDKCPYCRREISQRLKVLIPGFEFEGVGQTVQ